MDVFEQTGRSGRRTPMGVWGVCSVSGAEVFPHVVRNECLNFIVSTEMILEIISGVDLIQS